MDRKHMITVGVIAGAVAGGVLLLLAWRRKQADTPAVPAWLDYQQPPDSVAPDLMTLTPDQSWAANRCRPMIASCGEFSAGRRVRRTYPSNLAASPNSFIRASFDLGGRV